MTQPAPTPDAPLAPATRRRLDEVRRGLLRLHKALLEVERAGYEQVYGRIASGGELLQLVIRDGWFAWLHPVSELVVRIDELLDAEEPGAEEQAVALLHQVRTLLKPSPEGDAFGRRYYDVLQKDPGSILAHAEVTRLLPPEPAPGR